MAAIRSKDMKPNNGCAFAKNEDMEIKDLLQKPLEGMNNCNVQNTFAEIAKNLFRNFCIRCGTKRYYFAEIEFYYYSKDTFNKEWNEKTYPRDNKKTGDLFFHYSGVDICFDSSFDDGKFGGILIRSLKEDCGKFITGPFVCMLELLNVSSEDWPRLELLKGDEAYKDCIICKSPIARYGITYKDKGIEDEPLCFYDQELYDKYTDDKNNKETFEKARWDYGRNKDGSIKGISTLKRYYHRFDKKEQD